MTTYTIRPLGHTSWATTTGKKKAVKLRNEAIDAGLKRVVIIDDKLNDVTEDLVCQADESTDNKPSNRYATEKKMLGGLIAISIVSVVAVAIVLSLKDKKR